MPLRPWSVTAYSAGAVSEPLRFWRYQSALKVAKAHTSEDRRDVAYIDGPLPPYVTELREVWYSTPDQDKEDLRRLLPELHDSLQRCVLFGETIPLAMEARRLERKFAYVLGDRPYYRALTNVVGATLARATKVEGA